MTSHLAIPNYIERNIAQAASVEISDRLLRNDVLLTISGEAGSGKTTYAHSFLEKTAKKSLVILIDKSTPLFGCEELLSIIVRKSQHQVKLERLKVLNDGLQQVSKLGMFEYVSRRSPHPKLDFDILSDAVAKDFSAYQNVWIVLDHHSPNDRLVLDWLKVLLKKKRGIFLCVTQIGNFKGIDQQEFDLRNYSVTIPLFSDEQCEEFYVKSSNTYNALGLYDAHTVRHIANSKPLWLQWLTYCPKEWMNVEEKGALTLDNTVLPFIVAANQKDFLAQVATSFFLDKNILDSIEKESEITDGGWLFSNPLREYPFSLNMAIHHSIKKCVEIDIMNDKAPRTEKAYHQILHKAFAGISRKWALSENKPMPSEMLDILKGFFYHRGQNEDASVIDNQYGELILKFIIGQLGLLDEVLHTSSGDAPLKKFLFYLQNRNLGAAHIIWQDLCITGKFQSASTKASFLSISGFFLFLQGKDIESLNAFVDAINLDANCALAYFGRGVLFQEKKQKHDAINNLSKAIEINPYLATAYNERGALYLSLGESEKSLQDFKAALEVQPNYIQAMINLAILFLQTEDHQKAKKLILKALTIDKSEATAYIALMKRKADINILLN